MRWFFAVNENSPGFWDYVNLVQVAVYSAQAHTSLTPVCIYDGEENSFTAWLRSAGVSLHRRSTFLGAYTVQFSPIARGAYLRLEIPAICREQGWSDQFALYTDCDVMFQQDVAPHLQSLRPQFLAVAPETDRTDLVHFNSGVMLINVPAWEHELPAMSETFRQHMAECLAPPYDQALLQRHFKGRAETLPLSLNWKAYWPDNQAATIVHFHGLKPAHKYLVLNRRAPKELQDLVSEDYFQACQRWDAVLFEAHKLLPLPADPDLTRVQPGFQGFDHASGLGAQEGPFPLLMLPELRWGLAPATELTFTLPEGRAAEFEAKFQCPHTDQVVTVTLNNQELAQVPILRVSDPQSLVIRVPAATGENRLRLTYAHGYPQTNGDPRTLAVLFHALRIRLA